MLTRETVLFANERFYVAFVNHDYDAMAALWARTAPVICIHPGWQALTGRQAVLESWEQILSNPQAPNIIQHHAEVFIYRDLASVVCYEQADDNQLVAINAFIEEDGDIRMVQHQAGICANAPDPNSVPTMSMQ